MTPIVFESLRQASSALGIELELLQAARNCGSLAFRGHRVYARELLADLANRLPAINAQAKLEHPYWVTTPPPRLTMRGVAKAQATADLLASTLQPVRRPKGRNLEAAVKRELSPHLAAELVGLPIEAMHTRLEAVKARILEAGR